nr:O-fucosyltransferase family protein [Tanacetum cinerariifolium]
MPDVKHHDASVVYLLNHMVMGRQGVPKKREGTLDGIKGRARFKFKESFDQNPNPEFICTSEHTHILQYIPPSIRVGLEENGVRSSDDGVENESEKDDVEESTARRDYDKVERPSTLEEKVTATESSKRKK